MSCVSGVSGQRWTFSGLWHNRYMRDQVTRREVAYIPCIYSHARWTWLHSGQLNSHGSGYITVNWTVMGLVTSRSTEQSWVWLHHGQLNSHGSGYITINWPVMGLVTSRSWSTDQSWVWLHHVNWPFILVTSTLTDQSWVWLHHGHEQLTSHRSGYIMVNWPFILVTSTSTDHSWVWLHHGHDQLTCHGYGYITVMSNWPVIGMVTSRSWAADQS